jgi:hypothetical protein
MPPTPLSTPMRCWSLPGSLALPILAHPDTLPTHTHQMLSAAGCIHPLLAASLPSLSVPYRKAGRARATLVVFLNESIASSVVFTILDNTMGSLSTSIASPSLSMRWLPRLDKKVGSSSPANGSTASSLVFGRHQRRDHIAQVNSPGRRRVDLLLAGPYKKHEMSPHH